MDATILVVDDEAPILALLRYNLDKAGFRVIEATDGQEALTLIREQNPDLMVLDWMLPSLSGIEVCRQVRRDGEFRNLPIIMLTARGEEQDRVRGLEVGADDYLPKPFSPAELLARIRAVLRRIRPALSEEALTYADLHMDLAAHRVSRAGQPIHLGPREFDMLRFLMEHPGRVFSREQLLDSVWGNDVFVEPRTVDVHIGRLRKALNVSDGDDLIRTVRSAGYALDAA
jgi:two-component system phosphate regulon response regulator PhoB